MKSFTVEEISAIVNGEIHGATSQAITGLEVIKLASEGHVTFIGNRRYAREWDSSNASAAIVTQGIAVEPKEGRALIKVPDADLAMAKLLDVFAPEPPQFSTDIHPTAVIHASVVMGEDCQIGPGCYLGRNVKLGKNVTLYPNVTIFDDTEIGNFTTIWSGTVVRERSKIGSHCILHNNVSIGADGFGYRPSENGMGLVKIPHIGNVVIGNHVEIGANSCVDRAKFSSTILGDGCKIDNLVQIGHNCVLGRSCIMAGNSGLAGSVTLGDGVVIGGGASIKDHTILHSGAVIGAGSGVMGDVEAGKTVLGYPACDARDMLKQWVALRKLAKS